VTSAVAREGKTSLVCNLAAAFGLEGDRVLLIDADLRRPSVGKYLGINPTSGLSTVLLGECHPHDAVESWKDGLFDVLTSGPIPENPSELLGLKRISGMLTELESRYDVVLIDSPALLPVADASELARACDAALLVVRYGHTRASDVTDALAALRSVSARVLGCAFFREPQRSRTFRSRTDYPPVRKADRDLRRRNVDTATQTEHNEAPVDSIGISQNSLVGFNHNGQPTAELLSRAATEEASRTETDEPASSGSESSALRSQPSPVPRTDVTPSRDERPGKHTSGSRDDDGEPGAGRPGEARRSRSVTARDVPPFEGW
jgi:capsular exopolysaccharide synthesis family protein